MTLTVLQHAGIENEDVIFCANDTANVAKLITRLLSGEEGTCLMHVYQLIMEHATRKKTRTCNSKVVDSFASCDKLRKKAKVAATYLMNKKLKGRFVKYVEKMQSQGQVPVKIFLGNDTSAAGTQLFTTALSKVGGTWQCTGTATWRWITA